jgi:hypothetical protein
MPDKQEKPRPDDSHRARNGKESSAAPDKKPDGANLTRGGIEPDPK